jgi:iron-sulfur cluster assembly protein
VTFELPTILTVTGLAAEKAQDLLETRGYKDGLLRVFVVGGGCSGFQYGMSLAEAPDETDEVVTKNGVRFVIDRESLPLISGARLDYIDDVMKQGFSVSNPNASKTCACGTSFDTKAGTGADQARSCC